MEPNWYVNATIIYYPGRKSNCSVIFDTISYLEASGEFCKYLISVIVIWIGDSLLSS